MKTAFLTDPRFAEHETGPGHPERAARLTHTLDHLRAQQWFNQLIPVESQLCDERWLRSVHDRTLIERARQACSQGRVYLDSPDVAVSPASFEIALLAAGGVLALTDAVVLGKANNGFALIRPPGHHAERDAALGFCLFNNIAIAACYLQQEYGLEKIV
ncbi:MAG: histone deacetylase, partial [Pseudomonadota bacterium]|nr:histone deacetylase [Pseudomonadota bacterium]